jgi:hypothetical protein
MAIVDNQLSSNALDVLIQREAKVTRSHERSLDALARFLGARRGWGVHLVGEHPELNREPSARAVTRL